MLQKSLHSIIFVKQYLKYIYSFNHFLRLFQVQNTHEYSPAIGDSISAALPLSIYINAYSSI